MFTQPDDLAEGSIGGVLLAGWGFAATSLEYQAVGFGSHHWLASDARGARLFVTVDDLSAKRRTASDTTDAAFGRLTRAFSTALSLRADAGLAFVVAPVPAAGGQVLRRLQDRYSVVVHPFVAGSSAGDGGEFRTAEDRRTVLGLLIGIHGARSAAPCADDFLVPDLDELKIMMGQTAQPWDSGPYAERARDLLSARAGELEVLLAAYDGLVVRVAARPDRMVTARAQPAQDAPPGGDVFEPQIASMGEGIEEPGRHTRPTMTGGMPRGPAGRRPSRHSPPWSAARCSTEQARGAPEFPRS